MDKIFFITISLLGNSTDTRINPSQIGIKNTMTDSQVLEKILDTVYFFAGAAAVIAIIMGGFWYVTGGDNPQQVQKGKNAIIYASIGLILVLFAFAITGFVAGKF